ncbi:hypothetical protein [Mycolicibacterium austroafricanum]|uniref:hypothetical protein n=1 Tax=Mycolicibacterium austroafricanum TaxID=39687 RepID=UPI0011AE9C5A|nr:hypothetical protein [Mycolicibacterium austroafricanum]QZY47045.1 hypothetical protein K5L12_04650 [Mycolicibacterium austroafricanum]
MIVTPTTRSLAAPASVDNPLYAPWKRRVYRAAAVFSQFIAPVRCRGDNPVSEKRDGRIGAAISAAECWRSTYRDEEINAQEGRMSSLDFAGPPST